MTTVRAARLLLIAGTLSFSWLGFMAVHELGHVLTAWATGGALAQLALHPLEISWSAFVPNPRPLLVAWGGPVLGSALPLATWLLLARTGWTGIFVARFFAGFCLVANGAYLLIDAFERAGDGATLLRSGASVWQLWLFAAVTIPAGFRLWHGEGKHFGFGAGASIVPGRVAVGTVLLSLLLALLEVAFFRPS